MRVALLRGMLAGARRASGKVVDSGFLFIAVDPRLLMPREEFHDQWEEMLEQVRTLPRQPGVEAIRIPSERAFAERSARRREGVSLPLKVYDELRSWCSLS